MIWICPCCKKDGLMWWLSCKEGGVWVAGAQCNTFFLESFPYPFLEGLHKLSYLVLRKHAPFSFLHFLWRWERELNTWNIRPWTTREKGTKVPLKMLLFLQYCQTGCSWWSKADHSFYLLLDGFQVFNCSLNGWQLERLDVVLLFVKWKYLL